MNADGSGARQVTSGTLQAEYPSWAPDGERIAFDRGGHIYLVAPDGTGLRQVTSGGAQDFLPRWRP
jgi:Tol biopolymer transport system component